MKIDPAASTIPLPLNDLAALAVEHWRLATWLAALPPAATAQGRHALRRIADILTRHGIEARSMDNHPFDPGLAVRVLDVVDDPALPAGTTLILETLSPLILHNGSVLRSADVVTRRGTKP